MQQNLNEWVQKTRRLEETLNTERKIRETERKENTRNNEKVQSLLLEKGALSSQLARMREAIIEQRAAAAKAHREAQGALEKRQEEKLKAEALRHQSALDRSSQSEIEFRNEVQNLRANNEALKAEQEELRDRTAEQKREQDKLLDQIAKYKREQKILQDQVSEHEREQKTRQIELTSSILKFAEAPTDLLDLENVWDTIKAERLSDRDADSLMPKVLGSKPLHNESSNNSTGDSDFTAPHSLFLPQFLTRWHM